MKTCYCGKDFTSKVSRQIHCSDACRVKAANRRHYQQNREHLIEKNSRQRRKRQLAEMEFYSIYDVTLKNGRCNYSALAFSALNHLPEGIRDYLKVCRQWSDMLQAARLSAAESYIYGRDSREAYRAANREIYAALTGLGFRRASTRGDGDGRYNYEGVDLAKVEFAPRLHSHTWQPEKLAIRREEKQERMLLSQSIADLLAEILAESGSNTPQRTADILMLAVRGYNDEDVARRVGLAVSTVQKHLKDGRTLLTDWHEQNELESSLTTTCRVCGRQEKVSIHHIWPRHDGGPDIVDNLVALCDAHHAGIENWNLRMEWQGMSGADWHELFSEWLDVVS